MPSHTGTFMPGLLKKELLHAEFPMEDDTVQDMQLDIKVKLPPKVECFLLDLVQKKIKAAKQTLLAKQKHDLSAALSLVTQPAIPTQSTVVSSMVQPKKQRCIGGDRLKGPQICPCCNCPKKSQTVLKIHINQQHLIICSHAPSVANCTLHTTPDISIRSNIQHLHFFAESVPKNFISKQNSQST